MDPALLKEREEFKRRAMSNPVIEKRIKRPESELGSSSKAKPVKKAKTDQPKASKEYDYRNMTGSSKYNFAILAKIVKHLKVKHQEGDMEALSMEEILDETNQLDINARQKHWLITEALMNNPKVEVIDGDKFKFKPILSIHDRKGLVKLLTNYDVHGLGGVLVEEVEESVPNAAKVLKVLGDQVVRVTRPIDKRQVLYHNNKDYCIPISEDIQKLWRSVTVENVDERKIEEYLQRHSITSMQDRAVKKATKQKKRVSKRPRQFKAHNEHVGSILQDYSDK